MAGVLNETRHFYYTQPSQWQVIEERVGTSTSANRQFVWGLRYIDDIILRDRDTDGNGTLDERRYPMQDANWNVTGLVNTTGTVQQRFAYTAYGMPQFLNASFVAASNTAGWEILYAGYRFEIATSLFHVRHRVLHPALGGWVQRDPVAIAFSQFAAPLFEYVNGNPNTLVDFSGLAPRDKFYDVIADKDFWDWYHGLKDPGEDITDLEDLRKHYETWRDLGEPRGKGGKSGKGGKYRGGGSGGAHRRRPPRGGSASSGAVGAIAGAAATYGYDCYVAEGSDIGTTIATQAGLCRQLQIAIDQKGNQHEKKTFFTHTPRGASNTYSVVIVSSDGKCWLTASHQETYFSWSLGRYVTETVDDIPLGTCPAESRIPPGCSTSHNVF